MPQPDDHPWKDAVAFSYRHWRRDHHRHDAHSNAGDPDDIFRDGYHTDRAAAALADCAAAHIDPNAGGYTNSV